MDWSNERWVKLYTRDTMTAVRMGWQGRALLHELLRKVDRAGCMDGVVSPVADLSAITGLPEDVVEIGLDRLTRKVSEEDQPTVELNGQRLVIPNFIEAQESAKSDKQRQKDLRERRRAEFMSRNVTAPSQNVTNSHGVSRGVTACHAASRRDKTRQEDTRQDKTKDISSPSDSHPSGEGVGVLKDSLLPLSSTEELLLETGRKRKTYVYPADFEEFWQLYPNHIGGKKDGLDKWKKAKKSPQWPGFENLMDSLRAQMESTSWRKNNGQYIPKAQKWLKEGRWDSGEVRRPGDGYRSLIAQYEAEEAMEDEDEKF